MYASVPHPYQIQAIALLLSFVPPLLIIALTIAARFEALRRVPGRTLAFKGGDRCNLR